MAEPPSGQQARRRNTEEEERHHQGGVAQPSAERLLVALDGPDGALHGRQPEAVDVGDRDREGRHRDPVDLGSATSFVETFDRPPDDGAHVISQPNIMAWSSWARLWQWATYGPTKSRKPRYTIVDSPGSNATRSSLDTSSGWPLSVPLTTLPLRI